jgi:hypothetical protein
VGRRMKPRDRGSPWVWWRFRSRSDGSETAMRGDRVGIPSWSSVSELQHRRIRLRLVPILRDSATTGGLEISDVFSTAYLVVQTFMQIICS